MLFVHEPSAVGNVVGASGTAGFACGSWGRGQTVGRQDGLARPAKPPSRAAQ